MKQSADPWNFQTMASKKRRRAGKAAADTSGDERVPARPSRLWAVGLFGILLLVYLANGEALVGNDATANLYLPIQLLTRGRLTFTQEDSPQLFNFELRVPTGKVPVRFRNWNSLLEGKSMRSYQESGALGPGLPLYYLAPTQTPGVYANTFGLGAGLLALPAVAVVKPFSAQLQANPGRLWQVGKVVAAAAVAGSAVFVFLTALGSLGSLAAFLLALAYGLCTCVWSTSSQALWQHGPTELFLAMGTYLLLRPQRPSPLLAGLAYSLAVACRPTSLLVFLVVAIFQGLRDRRALLRFCLGALPVGALLVIYGLVVFGHPFAAGQLGIAPEVALAKTGNPGLWQTPLHIGLLGLLVSPGRGLLVYSPVAIFALWGAIRVWRDPAFRDWRPLSVAVAALWVLSAKWFDWWGGWCYGYRPIVDSTTLLAFLAIPVVPWIRARRSRWLLCAGLCGWSLGVQVLGVYCYDVTGWNGRWAYDVIGPGSDQRVVYDDRPSAERQAREHGGQVKPRERSVDFPAYRSRLWSVTDNPISYYLTHAASARVRRQKTFAKFLVEDG
jgi:hypothetical protein